MHSKKTSHRRLLVCGNWKLHHLQQATSAAAWTLVHDLHNVTEVDVAIAPVATVLFAATDALRDSPVAVAAQNVFYESKGAFTGEWSVQHLLELGCRYAIVGHSERRQYFGETDASVSKKVKACIDGNLVPIACVGESLQERQANETQAVITRQIQAILSGISPNELARLCIAYEPIWAIGTGQTATPEQAQQVHAHIRNLLEDFAGIDVANTVRIIYGGSVKPDNAGELFLKPDIDGGLVGGASLEPASLVAIVRAAEVANERKGL